MWALAITEPSKEDKVNADLTFHKINSLLFKVVRNVVRSGRRVKVTKPAFPSYVFVNALGRWEFIRSITNVIGFVRFGKEIATVSTASIEALQSRADKNGILYDVSDSDFRRGQLVRIIDGPMMGLAVYDQCVGPGRAIVFVDALGRSVPVSVSESLICPEAPRKRRRRRRRRSPRANMFVSSAQA